MTNKSKQIRGLMKMSQWDLNWMLAERIEDNPMVWMVSLNGFIVDVRQLPRMIQIDAVEKGIIPYLPEEQNS